MDFTGEATRSPSSKLEKPPEKRPKLYDPSAMKPHKKETQEKCPEHYDPPDASSVGEATLSRPLLEQPPEKCPKLYDPPAMKLPNEETQCVVGVKEASSPYLPFCEICGYNVGHVYWDCPDKSIGMGMGCDYCFGPCKKKEGDGDTRVHELFEIVKMCVTCGAIGKHWADDCAFHPDRLKMCPTCKIVGTHWAKKVCPFHPDRVRTAEKDGF